MEIKKYLLNRRTILFRIRSIYLIVKGTIYLEEFLHCFICNEYSRDSNNNVFKLKIFESRVYWFHICTHKIL